MTTTKTANKKVNALLAKSNYKTDDYSFTPLFNEIIERQMSGYDGTPKEKLKSFLKDMRHGCQSGMIGDFVYHSDCKAFYIEHIDSLENLKLELESQLGDAVQNKQGLPHYTFMCWLCFEEYCYDLDRTIFDS